MTTLLLVLAAWCALGITATAFMCAWLCTRNRQVPRRQVGGDHAVQIQSGRDLHYGGGQR